jgi:hypothetical protein
LKNRKEVFMSANNVNVQYRRGGREFRNRTFSMPEARQATLSQLLREDGVTTGLDNFEVYVRPQDDENEISVNRMEEMSLENVLRAASSDGEIKGKSFIVDITAEHRGAII